MAATEKAPVAPRSNNVVYVQNKLPWGLEIFLEQDGIDEATGKTVRVARPETKVTLAGANSSNVIGGYGITPVDADFWETWLKDHREFAPVKSGAIKAQPTRERAAAQAIDEATLITKLEPLDPDKPGVGLQRVSSKELERGFQPGL